MKKWLAEYVYEYPPLSTVNTGTAPLPVEHFENYLRDGYSSLELLNNLTGKWRLIYDLGKWNVQVQRRLLIPIFKVWVDESEIAYKSPMTKFTFDCQA